MLPTYIIHMLQTYHHPHIFSYSEPSTPIICQYRRNCDISTSSTNYHTHCIYAKLHLLASIDLFFTSQQVIISAHHIEASTLICNRNSYIWLCSGSSRCFKCREEGSEIALVPFVWLFSTVYYEMSPQIPCPWRGIVTLVAFDWLSPLCLFKCFFKLPASDDA